MRQTEQQVTHIHQPSAWPVPNACALSYHPGSGSRRQLFHPYQGSSAWYGRRTYERTTSCFFVVVVLRRAYTAECNAVLPINTQNTDTRPQHCTSSTVHYTSPQDGCTSTPNIAGVMSHVRHPLLNYTTSPLFTVHKRRRAD